MKDYKIEKIKDETHDVKTFFLSSDEDVMDFVPGQYVMVAKEKTGVKKPFTLANSPGQDKIQLTVKKMGEFTSALFHMHVGDTLYLEGPMGETLNFDEDVEEDVVFIAGGSGITPFISALRYKLEKGLENKMTLIYSNRTKKDIIFYDELKRLDERDDIVVVNTLTQETPEAWEGQTGFIDKKMVLDNVSDIKNKIWYICGPPGMNSSVKKNLHDLGISDDKIRHEAWELPGKND